MKVDKQLSVCSKTSYFAPIRIIFFAAVFLTACSAQPLIDEQMARVDGELPADFSGYWQRSYARDDDVNREIWRAYDKLRQSGPDQGFRGGMAGASVSSGAVNSLMALARLADEITRTDVLHIFQDSYEIRVDREDDFSLSCRFFNGIAQATDSAFGSELCGWDGRNLVSLMELPDGLDIVHRFTLSDDGTELRIATTLSSRTAREPFTLRRFYRKFDRPPGRFQCIETLSMKRVCTTAETGP